MDYYNDGSRDAFTVAVWVIGIILIVIFTCFQQNLIMCAW